MRPASDNDHPVTGSAPTARHRWRARTIATFTLTAVALVGGTSAVVASSSAVTRSLDGTSGVDLREVSGMYQGQVVSLDDIALLNDDGKARISVASHELGCQGVMLYFDTTAQADGYGRGYLERLHAREDGPLTAGADPCADTAGAPWFGPTR